MSKTRAELVTAALEELQVVGVDASESAEDSATVDARVDTVLADLLARNIILQPIGADIPDEMFDHLACVLARRVASRFGAGADAGIIASAAAAEMALHTISRINRGSGLSLTVDLGLRYPRASRRGRF